jgi:protoheme IX farnesyltransferase
MWLKRSTPQNIVIGGAAGAFPPMIGWAAVTGDVSLASLAMFAIIFLWTPPHFWALSLFRCGEYARAGVPMLPVVSGVRETKRQILFYSLALLPVTLVPWGLGLSSVYYAIGAGVLGLVFVSGAVAVWRDRAETAAKRLFGYSIVYLFLIFALLMFDHVGLS